MKLNASSSKHILHSFCITADFNFKSNEITLQNPNWCIVTPWPDLRTFMLPKLYMKMLYCALLLVLQRGVISRTGQETWCKYVQIRVLLDVLYILSLQTWCPTLVIHQWYTMKHQYIYFPWSRIHSRIHVHRVFVCIRTNGFKWYMNCFDCICLKSVRLFVPCRSPPFKACPAPSTDVSYVCVTRCCEQAQKAEGISRKQRCLILTTYEMTERGPRA